MDTKIKKGNKMRKQKSKKILTIITLVLVVMGLAAGTYFGVKAVYNAGVDEGRKNEAEEMAESVQSLGRAVQEKFDFQGKLSRVFSDLPGEINTEGIDKYIANLNELINQANNEEIKSTLNDYLSKWQEFKGIYESQDNNQITEYFNALKSNVADTASKIKTIYDEAIKAAITNL